MLEGWPVGESEQGWEKEKKKSGPWGVTMRVGRWLGMGGWEGDV
jgi:hypothetical protein